MSPSNIPNPFLRLKTRYIFLRLVLGIVIVMLVAWPIFSIGLGRPFDLDLLKVDQLQAIAPTLSQLYMAAASTGGLYCVWLACRKQGLDLRSLIGPPPNATQLGQLVLLAIAAHFVYMGLCRLSYSGLAGLAPTWVEPSVNTQVNLLATQLQKAQSPLLFHLTHLIGSLWGQAISVFLVFGLLLHRWATKWNLRTAIIIMMGMTIVANLQQPGFFLGAVLSSGLVIWVYLKLRSLLAIYLYLAVSNLFGYGLLLLGSILTLSSTHLAQYTLSDIRGFWLLGSLYIVVGLPWITLMLKNLPPVSSQLPYFANHPPMPTTASMVDLDP